MDNKFHITASIVIFNENENELNRTIKSFLNTPICKKLYLIDNSPTDILKEKFKHPDIEYIFVGDNVGFAAGHNLIINNIEKNSKYHLILNPDVEFEPTILPELMKVLENEKDIAVIAPKVVYPNGVLQESYRKYPKFLELIFRFISHQKKQFGILKHNQVIEQKSFYPDFLHGCFLLFKAEIFIKINGFDERYFMYMEDVDIARKIDKISMKKLYYPNVTITHVLKKGSSKSLKLFFVHLSSIFKYYQKWDWKL